MSAHVTSKSGGPFGWYHGARRQVHCNTVLPTSMSSMHLNMHHNLAPQLRAPGQLKEPNGLILALRTLDENRLPPKRYIGLRRLDRGQVADVSKRLAMFNTELKPAEAKGKFPRLAVPCEVEAKRKSTSADINRLCDRLSAPKLTPGQSEITRGKKMDFKDIDSLIQRLHKYDPKSHPAESKGVPARNISYSNIRGPQKVLSKEAKETVFTRLSNYNPDQWPAESPSKEQSEKRTASSRHFSEGDIDEIVERLTSYNKQKWPAESSGTREKWADGHHWNFKRTKTNA